MTKLEQVTAYRLEGKTFEQIGNIFGITKQAVQDYCSRNNVPKKKKEIKKVITYNEKRKDIILNNITVDENGCWLWNKSHTKNGYGRLSFKGKASYAHRVTYKLFVDDTFEVFQDGRSTEDSLHVCHKCDNPSCCNPDHLFVGTPLDNMKDRDSKGRHGRTFAKRYGV